MQDFIKSIFAGLMIGIAGLVYLNVTTTWVAAILFSIGLIMICTLGYNLYTGKVGYVKSIKDAPKMLKYIIGNFIGVFLVSLTTTTSSADLVNAKLQIPYYLLLLKSIGCGLLMYIAVDEYKIHNKSLIGIICCIPAFILAGFEHSIADMFYLCCSGTFDVKYLIFIGIVLIGNAIGALLHKMIKTSH